jgi:hypothetical protein
MKTWIFLMITASVLMIFTSCRKESSALEQSSIDLADDEAVSEAVFEDIFSSVDDVTIALDEAMKNGDSKSASLDTGDECPAITVEHPSTGIWPKLITIDYGTGCTGFYNNTRSGKIIIEVTGPRRVEGSKRTVSFDAYYFNGIKVEGTKVFENIGQNEDQNFVIAVTLTGGKLILPDGTEISRDADHQREWVAGFATINKWDDECLITGSATGINPEAVSYVRTITSPLRWKRVCAFIVSGAVTIERSDAEPFILDYGTGECDNKAVVSRGGESKEIQLRHRHRKWIQQ